jgi:hypothetical protein
VASGFGMRLARVGSWREQRCGNGWQQKGTWAAPHHASPPSISCASNRRAPPLPLLPPALASAGSTSATWPWRGAPATASGRRCGALSPAMELTLAIEMPPLSERGLPGSPICERGGRGPLCAAFIWGGATGPQAWCGRLGTRAPVDALPPLPPTSPPPMPASSSVPQPKVVGGRSPADVEAYAARCVHSVPRDRIAAMAAQWQDG